MTSERLDILFVWHPASVQAETLACIEAAEEAGHKVWWHQVTGIYDYWGAMVAAFQRGRSFLNIEHDNVLTLDQIADIEQCTEPLCAFAYAMHVTDGSDVGRDMLAMGATRFSQSLVRQAAVILPSMGPVTYEHVVTPVFFSLVYYGQQRYHQHFPNAVHIGDSCIDKTGLPPHIDPEALRDLDLPRCGSNWHFTQHHEMYMAMVRERLTQRGAYDKSSNI